MKCTKSDRRLLVRSQKFHPSNQVTSKAKLVQCIEELNTGGN